MLLQVEGLTVAYDTATVLSEVGLSVAEGELVGLVGPNGAGKTTLLRAVTGLVRWERETRRGTRHGRIRLEGKVTLAGERIDHLPPHEVVQRGLVHCPEGRRPFRELTVYENLLAGAYLLPGRRQLQRQLERVYHLFPVLKERSQQLAGTLSGGEQQMLATGRALMLEPRLLCIDEPSHGLAPIIRRELFRHIRTILEAGTTILLVEQDVAQTFALAHRSYILSHGRMVAAGTSAELRADETVRKSYLGL